MDKLRVQGSLTAEAKSGAQRLSLSVALSFDLTSAVSFGFVSSANDHPTHQNSQTLHRNSNGASAKRSVSSRTAGVDAVAHRTGRQRIEHRLLSRKPAWDGGRASEVPERD